MAALVDKEKVELPLHVHRHGTPTLFITLNGFQGNTKQLAELFLGFAKLGPGLCKIFFFHVQPDDIG